MLDRNSIVNFIVTVSILALLFGFDDGYAVFVFSRWLMHYLSFVVLIFAIVGVFGGFQFLAARWFDARVAFAFWKVHFRRLKRPVPLGAYLSVFFSLITAGVFVFPLISYTSVLEKESRLGRKYYPIPEFEEGLIQLSGIVGLLLVLLIVNALRSFGVSGLEVFLDTGIYFALFQLIPLPPFVGGKVFFASRTLYVFAVLFSFLIAALFALHILVTLLLALILALLLAVIYWFLVEKK